MKFVFVALAFLATAYAALPSNEYVPPLDDAALQSNVDLQTFSETSPLTDDGYRYKTIKRYRYRQRHRRELNELPSNQYLSPQQEAQVGYAPAPVEAPVAVAQETAQLADDGYRYKTVKLYRYRHRRDVNELPSSQYLPPHLEAQVVAAPAPVEAPVAVAQELAALADDGYRYKTAKRYREAQVEYDPAPVEAPVAVAQETAQLADDGYRYKTVKRYRYRHRRDVNELPSSQYLPPHLEAQVVAASAPVEAPVDVAQETAQLADDGYRYKTVKRYRYRHRRDVNELPSSQYLPPEQEAQVVAAPAPVEAPVAVAQKLAALAYDGYRYKTPKRYQEAQVEYAPAPIEAPVDVAQETAQLADDGYRYKTVYRVVYRRRV